MGAGDVAECVRDGDVHEADSDRVAAARGGGGRLEDGGDDEEGAEQLRHDGADLDTQDLEVDELALEKLEHEGTEGRADEEYDEEHEGAEELIGASVARAEDDVCGVEADHGGGVEERRLGIAEGEGTGEDDETDGEAEEAVATLRGEGGQVDEGDGEGHEEAPEQEGERVRLGDEEERRVGDAVQVAAHAREEGGREHVGQEVLEADFDGEAVGGVAVDHVGDGDGRVEVGV